MSHEAYLIRYGVMGHIGRFATFPGCPFPLERDQVVVLQTHRGVELGEVLVPVDGMNALGQTEWAESVSHSGDKPFDPSPDPTNQPRVLRLASREDLIRGRQAEESRPSQFTLCDRVLQEGNWPWDLVDVEPLLDGRATVLHYLGPHQLDTATLRARFRMVCDLDVMLEPVGVDQESDTAESIFDDEHDSGCGTCDCGAGGCGTKADPVSSDAPPAVHAESGCAPAPHSGCASCGISRLRTGRRTDGH